jgi:hypothetical protein
MVKYVLTLRAALIVLASVFCCLTSSLETRAMHPVPGPISLPSQFYLTQGPERVTNAVPPEAATTTQNSTATQMPKQYLTFKTPYEFWLTGLLIASLVFSTVALCFMAWKGSITPEFYKAYLIVVVVFSALFLIVAGYTDQQTAPVFSLLGTIAGYIFGRVQGESGQTTTGTTSSTQGSTSPGSSQPGSSQPASPTADPRPPL